MARKIIKKYTHRMSASQAYIHARNIARIAFNQMLEREQTY
ncbi:TPA: hypothetical protein ACN99B_001649 [Vibrio parahaemolyticus]